MLATYQNIQKITFSRAKSTRSKLILEFPLMSPDKTASLCGEIKDDSTYIYEAKKKKGYPNPEA